MKQVICFLLSISFVFLSLCGCVPSVTQTEQNADAKQTKNYCFDYQVRTMATGGNNYIMETDDSVYFLLNGYLYFSDKDSKDFLPLCTRPDCSHDNADCSAFINAVDITIYGDHIYYIDAGSSGDSYEELTSRALWRMKLDGTAHEKLMDIPFPKADFTPVTSSCAFVFTNKYAVVCSRLADAEHEEYSNFIIALDSLDTRPISAPWIDFDYSGGLFPMAGREDMLYGIVIDTTDLSEKGIQIDYLCELNCASGELRKICRLYDDAIVPEFSFYLSDDGLYYFCRGAGDIRKIVGIDLATGEASELLSTTLPQTIWMQFDWQNGLLFADRKPPAAFEVEPGLYFSSLELELLDFHPYTAEELAESGNIISFFQTESYIFGIGPNNNNAYDAQNGLPEWYVNKADVGTGKLMWKKWAP